VLESHLWISLYLKVVVAEVTLHAELVDGCGIVVAYFTLLCVVAHAHPYVVVAAITPDVVGHLEPGSRQT
jgi:hypothetical protein